MIYLLYGGSDPLDLETVTEITESEGVPFGDVPILVDAAAEDRVVADRIRELLSEGRSPRSTETDAPVATFTGRWTSKAHWRRLGEGLGSKLDHANSLRRQPRRLPLTPFSEQLRAK